MKSTEFSLPISMRDCSGGMMSGVDDSLIPDNCSRLSLGFRYDRIGCATQRYGYSRLGAAVSVGNANDGLHGYTNAAGTSHRVVASYNGNDYAYNFTSWTQVGTGATAGTRTRYASFLNLVFKVGGNMATRSWDGNVANTFTTTQLTGAPAGTLVLPYKSKLYIAGNASFPDRLYFSSIPDVTGNITWDIATKYVDVNPMDGDNITALMKTGTQMLIFKRNYIYRWNGTATDPEPVISVGTVTQETVANVNGSVIFFHPSGIWLTDGGIPVEISRPIKNFVDAIPAANYPNMCAYADGATFGLYCGTVVVNGRTFTNLVMEFDTNTQAWQMHAFGHSFRTFANAKFSDGSSMLVGGATTYVERMFNGTTDDSLAINFERETKRLEFDGLYSEKVITDVVFFLQGATGSNFYAIPVDGYGIVKAPVQFGTSKGAITFGRGVNAKGHALSFKISGSNVGAPAVWRGFNITDGRTMGLVNPPQ